MNGTVSGMAEVEFAESEDVAAQSVSGRRPCCPYCSGPSRFFVASTDFNRRTTDERFYYFQCTQCGLVFMDPTPLDMGPYYRGGYGAVPETLSALRVMAANETYRLEPILRYKTGGHLLEIGPWHGVFCSNAKDAGFHVSAIEMDDRCVHFLKTVVGINVVQSSDPATALRSLDHQFDVIALWHSLEHLPRPWEVIQEAAVRVAPGGLLLVAIPNIESYEFSVLHERWRHLDTPRHLFFYPASSLIALCESLGFKTLEVATNDQISKLLAGDTWDTWAAGKSNGGIVRKILRRTAFHFAQFKERGQKGVGPGLTAVFQMPTEPAPLSAE